MSNLIPMSQCHSEKSTQNLKICCFSSAAGRNKDHCKCLWALRIISSSSFRGLFPLKSSLLAFGGFLPCTH